MNVNKRNNYQLTGSIHTLSLISLPVTDIDESIAPCFDTLSSRENLSYSKINANKLVGDLFSYDEFKTAFDTILGGAGIESYSLSRFDMRFDSFDPEHYRDYAKLNRYLISALAVTYNVQNCYDSRNLFSQKQLSVAIKNKRFECENYDKEAESGGRDPAYARLELRSKCLTSNDIEKQFHGWYIRLDKALKNLDKVHQRYNDELEKIYKEEKDAFPVKFRSLTDFLIQYQNCIEYIKSYQVQRPTGKWFYLSDVHAIAEYYNTSTYSIYQLLTRSPKEIKGNYEIYESDNIKIKVRKEQ